MLFFSENISLTDPIATMVGGGAQDATAMAVMQDVCDGRAYAVDVPAMDGRGALPSPRGWLSANLGWLVANPLDGHFSSFILICPDESFPCSQQTSDKHGPPVRSSSLLDRATKVFNQIVARCSICKYL